MKNKLTKPGLKLAFKMFFLQFVIIAVCALFSFLYWGTSSAYSAFIGGFIGSVPQLLFAFKAFKYAGATNAQKVVKSFYAGEKLKLFSTAILIALALRFISLDVLPFFGTFCLIVVMPLFTPIFLNFNHWDK